MDTNEAKKAGLPANNANQPERFSFSGVFFASIRVIRGLLFIIPSSSVIRIL
jgi:hypothetical protein